MTTTPDHHLATDGSVLYVSSVDVSLTNGPGVNEREFIISLYRAIGDRAHFIIPRPAQDLPAELPQSSCTFSRPHRRHHPLHFLPHVVSQQRAIDALLAERHIDLMVFRLGPLPLSFLYTAWKHRVPFVLRHLSAGLASVLTRRGGRLGRLLAWPNRYLISQVARRAAMADAVSQQDLAEVIAEYGIDRRKIIWIDNTVNMDRFYPVDPQVARATTGLTQFDPVVGYVGNYAWRRGAAQLLEAAPYLIQRFPKLGVVVLGNGDGIDALRQRAEELGIAEHCIFTGQVAYEQVPEYVNALNVGVSILEPCEFAASEQKVRQYLACGKPVVATPGSNQFLEENQLGSVVDPEQITTIAQELQRWLSLDDAARVAFTRKAVAYVNEKFSSARMMSRRLDLWSQMLAQTDPAQLAPDHKTYQRLSKLMEEA